MCSYCGRHYIGVGRRYYSCVGRACGRRIYGKNGTRCPAPLQYRAELESIIWDLCEGYICNPDKIALELAEQHERERVKQRDHARELAALERTLAEQAKKLARAEDALVDGGLSREAYDRQVERIRAVTEPAQRKREWLRAAERSVGEMAREAKKACTLLEKLRAKEYSFEERRAIVMQLVERITVEPPSPYAEESNDCLRIDFRFHYEGPGWPRGKPVTTAEAQAGAQGLLIALAATPAA